MPRKGLFIVLEGIDGSGTTTQTNLLHDHLKELSKYNDVLTTREPWKNEEIEQRLREDKDAYSGGKEMASLYVDDRRRHQEELIIPKLEKNVIVISDRHMLSTFAYQHTQGVPYKDLVQLHNNAGIIRPDVIFFLDVDFETAHKRVRGRGGDLEKFEKDPGFVRNLIENYRILVEIGVRRPKLFGEIREIGSMSTIGDTQTMINLDLMDFYHSWKGDI